MRKKTICAFIFIYVYVYMCIYMLLLFRENLVKIASYLCQCVCVYKAHNNTQYHFYFPLLVAISIRVVRYTFLYYIYILHRVPSLLKIKKRK